MSHSESYKLVSNSPSKRKGTKIMITVVVLLLLAGIVGIVTWQVEKSKTEKGTKSSSHSNIPANGLKIGNSYISNNMSFTVMDSKGNLRINGHLSQNLGNASIDMNCSGGNADYESLCITWPNETQLEINFIPFSESYQCYAVIWTALGCVDQEFRDCYDLSGAHWYGGYTSWNQYWPIERSTLNLSAFVANDYSTTVSKTGIKSIGGVQERYFINSKGIGININQEIPLYISVNESGDQQICFVSKYDKYPYTYTENMMPTLIYRICMSDNVRKVHEHMSMQSFGYPSAIPDKQLFKYPIWSTWAQYHEKINQSSVVQFAENILKNNFSHSQLEIDDNWTTKYGDLDFDVDKFPNASEMVNQLNDMGFRVTVWVHPFCNLDSKCFTEAAEAEFLIKQYESKLPALVSWWDGTLAGILDVSNPKASKWFLSKLQYLKKEYNISSYKFDAGENTWLPTIFQNSNFGPNFYAKQWAELAFHADMEVRHQEVRVGVQSQWFPIIVRMLDKSSSWGYENGLKTLIPTALTFGILGYPFILPDMIGGNAYIGYPDRELYIRWLQATALLPSMQFSIAPWNYDDEVIRIAQKFDQLHQKYSDQIIQIAENIVGSTNPIIRPLWWIAPDDASALTINSEFLLGDTILVAPILDKGARSRDIYLPVGKWSSNLNGNITLGPVWIRNYPVSLDQLPIFTKVK